MIICFLLTGCANENMPRQSSRSASSFTAASSMVSQKTSSPEEAVSSKNGSEPSAKLKSILAGSTTHKIVFFKSFDAGNNQNAAFAITDAGDVWYINDLNAQKLKTGISFPEDNQPDKTFLWTADGTKIFKCENNAGGSSSVSYAWYVKGGKPVELPYAGMDLTYIGNSQFTTVGDAFDSAFTDGLAAGHTYKIYYLYWTAGGLKEYGGLKITRKQLLKAKGAKAAVDAITESGHVIDGIYYRANNIININYHSGDKKNGNFDNVTLVYKNNVVTPLAVNNAAAKSFNKGTLDDFSYGGIYKDALFSKIATYPAKFPADY